MRKQRLKEIAAGFPTARVAIVGDFFLDKYLDVDPEIEERSVETDKRAHQVVRVRHSPGAAGTVANNLVALNAGEVHTVGCIGDDGEGFTLRRDLQGQGVDTGSLVVATQRFTPTYLKPCDVGGGLKAEHERYDTKNRTPAPPDVEDRIEAGDPFAEIEIVVGVHELISPLEGDIIAVNRLLQEDVNILRKDPYGDGWMLKVRVKDPNEVEDLYDLDAYEEVLESD